jgi:tetratricopeptide (TPR) repeat protein
VIGSPRSSSYCSPRIGWGGSHYYNGYCNSWNRTWWDPCHGWGNRGYGGFHYSVGCGSFGWGFSLWQPWFYARNCYWDSCYSTCWWSTWSQPVYATPSYWWYPSSTYCPTYLYVPSTVVVVDREPEEALAAGAPVVRETIVAGGGVVGSARIRELPADASSEDLGASLAVKYVDLGDFYFRADRFADAVEAYGRARNYAPNDASVHFVLADAAFANGDYHYAAFLVAEAIRLDPAMATSDADKRTFYRDGRTFADQMAALDRYLEKQPYDASVHLLRGYNLRFSGQQPTAKAAFERVLEIDPDNRAAKTFLAAMQGQPAREPTDR